MQPDHCRGEKAKPLYSHWGEGRGSFLGMWMWPWMWKVGVTRVGRAEWVGPGRGSGDARVRQPTPLVNFISQGRGKLCFSGAVAWPVAHMLRS